MDEPVRSRLGPARHRGLTRPDPASLSQEVGLALGAQAGEARIRDVVSAGGFTRFRRVAETPFNLVFEAPLITQITGGATVPRQQAGAR